MKVIGFNYNKISVEKKKEFSGSIDINTNINIKDLKRIKIPMMEEKNTINFEFDFDILYGELGQLSLRGEILIIVDDEKLAEKIEEDWKNKKISEEVRIRILNIIFSRCNLKALQLEEDLGLPFHIPTPRLSSTSKTKNKK